MASSNKRERELARAKHARQHARRQSEANRAQRRQRIVAIAVVAALVLVAGGGFLATVVLRDDDANNAAQAEAGVPDVLQPGDQTVPGCSPAGTPRENNVSFQSPQQVISGTQRAELVLNTNCGPITIRTVNADKAPETVNSMTFLAQQGFFDRTQCHRLTTEGIYVLQCGDPEGDGSGDAGYTVADENLPEDVADGNYPKGTVAMANAGPGTAGSQFFIVYDRTTLGPNYTIWGEVIDGLDRVEAIAEAGTVDTAPDGPPLQPVMIDTVDVEIS